MPGMTMSFRVDPKEMGRLQPGQTIDAVVDTATEPWTLHDVRVVGMLQLVATPPPDDHPRSIIRNVKLLSEGDPLPETSFIDQDGKPFTFAALHGSNVVLSFIFTRCRDTCPLISAKFERLQTLLRASKAHLVEISLDPAFDRPEVLRRYSRQFHADFERWTLLTGTPDPILDFAAQMNVTALEDPRFTMLHSERTVIVDPNGTIRQFIDEVAWSPEEIVEVVKALDREQSNPLLRFNLWLSSQAVAVCGNRVAKFSGFQDLLVVLAVFLGVGWLLYRVARVFTASDSR
jgi:protein SCO1/2